MLFQSSLASLALLPLALGAVHEQWAHPPRNWAATGRTTAGATTTFTIALNLQNIDQLESKLLAVSTPGGGLYGQHWSADQASSFFSPSQEAVSSVTAWLKSQGVAKYHVEAGFIDFTVGIDKANQLFNASYQYYASNGVSKLRTLSYSIPDHIQEHVALVDPGTYFGSSKAFRPHRLQPAPVEPRAAGATKTTVDAACQTSITPACLKELYNVGGYTPNPRSGSVVGFGSFLNQSALYSDLADYEAHNRIPPQNFTVISINGGSNDQDPATAQIGEADLDVQNIVGVSHPLPVVEYSTGGSPPFNPNIDQPTAADNYNEPYVPYYRYLVSQPNWALPHAISNSYGDEEDSVPYNYAVLTCNLAGILGLRGITVLVSSGDLGVGSGCLAPDNKTVEFNAIFPATCPYITSVGGTVDVTPEIAWDGSSGGFSKYFKRPAYQDHAIAQYLKTVSPETYAYYAPYTDWSGRGFPDVAGHSVSPDYQVVYDGELSRSGGTSAAAPVWAAIVGLLNDARLRAGKPTLGFLNPLVYALGPKVLTDITGGYSVGCNGYDTQSGGAEPAGSGIVPGARWNATAGWDPTTGYGTPNFQKLKALVLSL